MHCPTHHMVWGRASRAHSVAACTEYRSSSVASTCAHISTDTLFIINVMTVIIRTMIIMIMMIIINNIYSKYYYYYY